jgi:hypothetical protein
LRRVPHHVVMVSVAALRGGKTGLPEPRLDEPPGGEDASPGLHGSLRRLVFHAAHLMHEIDASLRRELGTTPRE